MDGHLSLLVLAALADEPAHGYAIVERVRGRGAHKAKPEAEAPEAGSGGTSSKVPNVVITNGALDARDEAKHVRLKVASFDAELRPDMKLALHLRGVHGVLALGAEAASGPTAAARP